MQSYSFYFNHKDIFFNIFLSFVKFFAAFRDNVSLFSRHSYYIYKGRTPTPLPMRLLSFSFRKNGTIFEAREEEKGAERVSFIYFQTVTGIRRRTTGLRAGFFGLMTGASKPKRSDESSRFGLFYRPRRLSEIIICTQSKYFRHFQPLVVNIRQPLPHLHPRGCRQEMPAGQTCI